MTEVRSEVMDFIEDDLEHIIRITDILILAAEGCWILQVSLRGLKQFAKESLWLVRSVLKGR
jgi:hypothetical protein